MLNGRSMTPGPRPRPPAKMRRQSSLTGDHLKPSRLSFAELSSPSKGSRLGGRGSGSVSPVSSPPPAYGSGYELQLESEERTGRKMRLEDTLLGSPIPTTYKLMGNPNIGEVEEWMNERSKEELVGLLTKAEELFKERENDMGLTSKAAKDLYESNAALRTKHEALLARLPNAPISASPSTPGSPDRVITRNRSFSELDSPSPAPPPPLYRHTRAASISTAEISILADQNAELMHKLEQLESESTSADHAGRRELRRLEKEISMLRQALEKTQAKSEELEAKTKGLDKGIDKAVEDAWKRRKERERKISALRRSTTSSAVGTPRRAAHAEEDWERPVRNFAPMGSAFGGPSRHFPISNDDDDGDSSMDDMGVHSSFTSNGGESIAFPLTSPPTAAPKPDLDVVAQLLQKVKELEETNTRILQQQAETTNKLQAVQRDTEHITKVYETLAEPQPDIPTASDSDMDFGELRVSTSSRFGSLRRRVDVDRDSVRRGKGRQSVHGMFRGPSEPSFNPPQSVDVPPVPFSWHRPSYSVGSAINSPGLAPALNFSDDPCAELSPIGTRLTLDSELQQFSSLADQGWDSDQQKTAWHLRSQSLSNLSQFSVPPSPVPAAPLSASAVDFQSDLKTPVATEFPPSDVSQRAPSTPPQTMPGTLPLVQPDFNIQPPTPSKSRVFLQRSSSPGLQVQPPLSPGLAARSPRNESIAARIRARKARWEDGRFGSMSSTTSVWGSPTKENLPLDLGLGLHPVFVPPSTLRASTSSASLRSNASSVGRRPSPQVKVPMKIATVVDTLVDQFGGGLTVEDAGEETSPESDYEDAADYIQETGDEATKYEVVGDDGYEEDEEDDFDDDDEQTMVNQTPQFSDNNALQLHRNGDKVMRHRAMSPSTRSFNAEGSVSSRKSAMKVADPSKKAGGGWGSVLLEVWLWLQFAVIVFVFLCAMAKRGPKAVLADAEQRTRTRKQSLHIRR